MRLRRADCVLEKLLITLVLFCVSSFLIASSPSSIFISFFSTWVLGVEVVFFFLYVSVVKKDGKSSIGVLLSTGCLVLGDCLDSFFDDADNVDTTGVSMLNTLPRAPYSIVLNNILFVS